MKFHRFLKKIEEDRRKKSEEPPLTDYDRQVLKTRGKKKAASSVPQLGTQSKQSIPPFKVLSTYEQQLLDFAKSAGLTPAQLQGEEQIAPHKGAHRSKYVPGQPLVWPQLVQYLPTRMYELHNWHMTQAASGMTMLYVRIEDHHFFRG